MKLFAAVAAVLCAGAAAFAADNPDVKKFTFSNDVEVYAIRDKDTTMKSSLFTDYTKASSLKKEDLKKEYPASVNCFVLRAKLKTFLIDAGNYDPKGSLVTKLASVNIRPKAIDYILITHLHPDHVGGLIDKDGGAVFPNAKVYVSYDEWKHWSPIIEKQKPTEILRQFSDAYKGRIQTMNTGEPVVYAMKAPGHTPGHSFFRQGRLRFVGDIVHAVDLQIGHPEYCASFDMNQKQAYQTRLSFLENMSKEGNIVFGAHIPFPGVGYIIKTETGYRFEPYK
ncbi:MAG: MBL fold metallo-hydrolase [Lentisphaeria bacterium]|jgi:glyoxylase-like metal-dependent hydrolase (beta-lactamase superfamily II)|nr:MBL fold metallo-hydrolase [Lentisphaeria bacterium]